MTKLRIAGLCMLLVCLAVSGSFALGIIEMLENHVYNVESDKVNPANTVNITVIRGTDDTVWIFGAGYGNKGGDFPASRGNARRSGMADARDVDTVITGKMGMTRSKMIIQFIAPHFHLDHLNAEFLNALVEIGYDAAPTRYFIHTNDFANATCNTNCAMGAPYDVQWTVHQIRNQFVRLGKPGDPCGRLLKKFSSYTGDWKVLKGGGTHTAGPINLQNDMLKLYMPGAAESECNVPKGYQILTAHGNARPYTSPIVPPPIDDTTHAELNGHWEVAGGAESFTSNFAIQNYDGSLTVIYNCHGQRVGTAKYRTGLFQVRADRVSGIRTHLTNGIYFIRFPGETSQAKRVTYIR